MYMFKLLFSKVTALVLLACLATGCGYPRGRVRYAVPIVETTLTVAALIAWQEQRANRQAFEREMLERSYAPPPPPVAAPLPPSPRDRVSYREPTRFFDGAGARAALNQVDLSPCKEHGAQRGWGRARLTFTDQGYIAKVAFEEPKVIDPSVMQCIGDRLGTARAPAFVGADVTMGYSWFVP